MWPGSSRQVKLLVPARVLLRTKPPSPPGKRKFWFFLQHSKRGLSLLPDIHFLLTVPNICWFESFRSFKCTSKNNSLPIWTPMETVLVYLQSSLSLLSQWNPFTQHAVFHMTQKRLKVTFWEDSWHADTSNWGQKNPLLPRTQITLHWSVQGLPGFYT